MVLASLPTTGFARPVSKDIFPPSIQHDFTPSNLINSNAPMIPIAPAFRSSPPMAPVQSPHQQNKPIAYPNQAHLPHDDRENMLNLEIFMVAFKTTTKDFILGVRVPAKISIGDAVIVSVDKGEDLGIVTRILSMKQFVLERFQSVVLPPQFNINRYVGCILRAATPREVRMLSMKTGDENEVLEFARHLARNVYRVPLLIHDAEFQFDRHKITLYYECQSRVDYRDLVSDICNTFKARVWMERVNF
eukprot:gene38540-47593_t